jgi:hypothetical protein
VRIVVTIFLTLMIIAAHAQEATTSGEGDAGAPAEEERQEAATEEDELSEKIDAASGSLDDSIGSIEAGRETFGQNFKGDLRVGYTRKRSVRVGMAWSIQGGWYLRFSRKTRHRRANSEYLLNHRMQS